MDGICISKKVVKMFECAICHKHIFVAPITTEDGTSFKCGRCSSINSDHTLRVHSIEKLASFMNIPCVFEGCEETVPWGNVTEHEKLCKYRIINCPSGLCRSTYPINTLVSHFKEKHKNHMSSNEYQLDCIALGAHLRLILHKGLPYLLFFYENKINIWISVYSVNTEDNDVMFQIQFQSVDTNKSLVFQANVTPFDDQEHCLNCLHHICSNNYHKYSKVGSNYDIINKSMEFSVEKSYLSSLLSCKHVYYTVNIMEETEDSLQKSLIRNLECPVCKMPMSAPIFRCRKGHAICNICSKKLTKCPLCKSQLTNSRSFALEGIAQDIELCCSNKKNGCTFTGNVNQCIAHENYCSVKPIHNLKM